MDQIGASRMQGVWHQLSRGWRALKYPVSSLLSGGLVTHFICCFSGGGSSLLGSLLDQHLALDYYGDETTRRLQMSDFATPFVDSLPDLEAYRTLCFTPFADPQGVRLALLRYYLLRTESVVLRTVVEKSTVVSLTHAGELKHLFARAKFILYYRDPVANIEGLRRKWRLFQNADLEALADFWSACQLRGVEHLTKLPREDVMCLTYEEVVQAPEGCVERVRQFLQLGTRARPKLLPDRPNVPGKALRHVSKGLIQVEQDADRQSKERLSDAQIRVIQDRTQTAWQALQELHARQRQPNSS